MGRESDDQLLMAILKLREQGVIIPFMFDWSRWVLLKMFSVVKSRFSRSFGWRAGLGVRQASLELLLSVLVAISWIKASIVPCLGYMRR
jgi:hypothetical protein